MLIKSFNTGYCDVSKSDVKLCVSNIWKGS